MGQLKPAAWVNFESAPTSASIHKKLATNQGVVGSIPVSRTKIESLQRKLQAFSFVRHPVTVKVGEVNAILMPA